MMVGRIVNHDAAGEIRRGMEKGMFEFGGSTIVLLVKKDAVIIDGDILKNTADGFETVDKNGGKIGRQGKFSTEIKNKGALSSFLLLIKPLSIFILQDKSPLLFFSVASEIKMYNFRYKAKHF